ncbi:MAG TPA: hypothetical protein VJ302_30100 [Blastocatellia bacterium]|nr:hypothetical protein [Blastocatellia bacterium]
MLSEYRQRHNQYLTDLYREDYLFRSGRKDRHEAAFLAREYSDLFSLSVIGELRSLLKETSASRETELKSLGRLIAGAVEGHLAMRVQELSAEIEHYERTAEIEWGGRRIGIRAAGEALASESDPADRRALYSRRAEVLKGEQDLQAELFERLQQASGELGADNYLILNRQLRGVAPEAVTDAVIELLTATESAYLSALGPWLGREAGTSLDEATAADLVYLQRFTRFDHLFPGTRLIEQYRALCAGLGFNLDKQANLEIETRRPGRPFCSPIRVPEEIKLGLSQKGGQAHYRESWRAAGRAQNFAWTSRELHPEFRRLGDAAVPTAWGLLFENLMLDEVWLAETCGMGESRELRHALGLCRLMEARRNAALSIYEAEFHSGRLSGRAGDRYVELMAEALRVRFDQAEHLEALRAAFFPANFLRAVAFELQLREYLKTRFERRWWSSRKAGEMLIDLWNTGQRYTADELASMIGLGPLDYTGLAVDLVSQLNDLK